MITVPSLTPKKNKRWSLEEDPDSKIFIQDCSILGSITFELYKLHVSISNMDNYE